MKQLTHQTKTLFISTIHIDASVFVIDGLIGHNPNHFPFETMVFRKLNEEDLDYGNPLETKWYATQAEAEQGHQAMIEKYAHHEN